MFKMMKKTNKISILLLFVIYSIVLFFVLKYVFVSVFVSRFADPFTELGQAYDVLPYWFGSFSVLLITTSLGGMAFFKKKEKIQVYVGLRYSFIYSIIILMAFIAFLIYYILVR